MKNSWNAFLLAVILAWGMPWVMMALADVLIEQETQADPLPEILQTQPQPTQGKTIQTIRVLKDGTVKEMPMTEYLTGVLISEMPGSFHQEPAI